MATSMKLTAWKEVRLWSFIGAGLLVVSAWQHGLSENRAVRDILARTPFHSVLVDSVTAVSDGVYVEGSFVKRRCTFDSLSAYALFEGGDIRVHLDTSPEEADRPAGNRPPSPRAQLWGPWFIKDPNSYRSPDGWAIYAHHRCPEKEDMDVNLFASGKWESSP